MAIYDQKMAKIFTKFLANILVTPTTLDYVHFHGRQLESAVRDWTAGPKLDHWTEVEVDWTYINIIVSIYGHIYDHIWSYMDIYSL